MQHIPHYFAGNSKQLYAWLGMRASCLYVFPCRTGRACLSDMAKGTRRAADNDAKLANISYDGATSSSVAVSINYSDNNGAVRTELHGNGSKVKEDDKPDPSFTWNTIPLSDDSMPW